MFEEALTEGVAGTLRKVSTEVIADRMFFAAFEQSLSYVACTE